MNVDVYKINHDDGFFLVPAGVDPSTVEAEKNLNVSMFKENIDINQRGLVGADPEKTVSDINSKGYSIQSFKVSKF
jgi:hypothetical protein